MGEFTQPAEAARDLQALQGVGNLRRNRDDATLATLARGLVNPATGVAGASLNAAGELVGPDGETPLVTIPDASAFAAIVANTAARLALSAEDLFENALVFEHDNNHAGIWRYLALDGLDPEDAHNWRPVGPITFFLLEDLSIAENTTLADVWTQPSLGLGEIWSYEAQLRFNPEAGGYKFAMAGGTTNIGNVSAGLSSSFTLINTEADPSTSVSDAAYDFLAGGVASITGIASTVLVMPARVTGYMVGSDGIVGALKFQHAQKVSDISAAVLLKGSIMNLYCEIQDVIPD